MTEPRRNPHALHEAAAGWRDMGKHLDGLVRDLDRHVGAAASADWHGPAGEAFAAEWHQLKRSVDESLPVFELAAADLENAADNHHEDSAGGAHDSGSASAAQPASQSSGQGMAYGLMALGQLANGLGGAFGKRGGRGGQTQAPQLRHQWDSSTAAHGPDPFGTPRDGAAATRGGEGIAKGVRTNPAEAQRAAEEQEAKAAARQKAAEKSAAKAADGKAPAKGSAPAGDTAEKAAGAASGEGRAADASAPPGPDVTQHGAFG
ncbi:WXG100 family type VII secretion target [Streptomyces noursei]|uniref:WXG100 family type VII secretion target n=1 Tax=Streptomyces noursei TaxID=1971 RepID=UPI0019634892|nr:WXG100 family type VII secretion target [Streptomyces noursei]QRX94587.1 WXG100 family type VII secretion target [Streptomyces noursei]